MSTVALSSDLSYRSPVHSSSVWGGPASEWEVSSGSSLAATEIADEDTGQPIVISSAAQSIAEFEHLIQQVMADFWRVIVDTQTVPAELNVEQEVIAHLPPKQVFETTLRVRYAGRAGPNITLELVDSDL